MTHLAFDDFVLLAFGQHAITDEPHLDRCRACSEELKVMRQIAETGREIRQVCGLELPPESVWREIERRAARLSSGAEPVS